MKRRKKLVRRKNPLIQITSDDLPAFRKDWHTKQYGICPLLKCPVPYDKIAVDHKHKRKNDPVGPNGDGLIRGVIQMQANALEGKIINNFKRLGLEKFLPIHEYLRNLADYLEHPPIPQIYIHPDEAVKPFLKLSKRSFNTLRVKHNEKYPKRKSLVYPKRKYITKDLEKLFHEFNIKPQFLKE